jgi:2-keto-3-deoxy-L-rhamnonate aldolase RhmA
VSDTAAAYHLPTLRERLAASKDLVVGTFVTLPAPGIAEMFGLIGYDFIVVDMEHTSISDADLENLVRGAAVAGAVTLARVFDPSPGSVIRTLATGVDGILFPMVETAEEARSAVAALRLPPEGIRGWATLTRAAGYYVGRPAKHEPFCAIQIETKKGVDNAEEILAVEGVEMVFLGPGDLRSSIVGGGFTGDDVDRELQVAVDRVVGLFGGRESPVLGVPPTYPTIRWDRQTCIQRGARAVTLGSDVAFLATTAKRELEGF